MSMNIDKPLDDIVAESKKKSRGTRRPRGPRNAAAAGGAAPAAPAAAAPRAAAAAAAPVHVGDKIIVSNLPTDVNEQQVKELFTTTIGPIRTCSLAYNAQGLSKGTATVHFVKAEHATAAYQQYNKRLIDGKRAMRVEIVVDPARAAAKQPLTARIAAAAPPSNSRAAQSATVAAAGGSAVQGARQPGSGRRGGAGAGGRRRGGGGGGRGARGSGSDRPKVTAESLDAEMSDYQAQANGAAAAGGGETTA